MKTRHLYNPFLGMSRFQTHLGCADSAYGSAKGDHVGCNAQQRLSFSAGTVQGPFLLIKSPSLCLFLIVLIANWHFFLFKIICIFLLGGIPIAGELCVLAGRFPKYILYIMIAKPYSWVKSILGVGHVWRFTGLALSCCCLFSQLSTSLFSLEFFWLLLLLTIKAQHISVLLVNLRTLSWFYPYSWFIRHCLRSNDRPQKPMACEFLRTCRNVHMWRIPGSTSTSIIRCHISTIYPLVI